MRSRGGGGDARLKNFNLTNCGYVMGSWAVDSILRWPAWGAFGVADTPLFGLNGYESLNRVWFSGSGVFLLFCTTSL